MHNNNGSPAFTTPQKKRDYTLASNTYVTSISCCKSMWTI
jgi:hypothetical protein